MGYTNVAHYPEGKQGWIEAGFPVDKAASRKAS
jgi:rhodanese-related sulfurtransferase